MRSVVCIMILEDGNSEVCSAWFKSDQMARNRHVANDMALDKLALPAIPDADIQNVLRTWEFQSQKERIDVF